MNPNFRNLMMYHVNYENFVEIQNVKLVLSPDKPDVSDLSGQSDTLSRLLRPTQVSALLSL